MVIIKKLLNTVNMKNLLLFLLIASFSTLVSYSADSLVVTAQPVLFKVNPLDTGIIGIAPIEASFQFDGNKGLTVYPVHYIVTEDSTGKQFTVLQKPNSYFIPKAALDMIVPGFFDNFQRMITSSLLQNAATLRLYNTQQWRKISKE